MTSLTVTVLLTYPPPPPPPPDTMAAILADDIFKHMSSNENDRNRSQISLKVGSMILIDNKPALVKVMTSRRTCDKPLPHWRIYATLGGRLVNWPSESYGIWYISLPFLWSIFFTPVTLYNDQLWQRSHSSRHLQNYYMSYRLGNFTRLIGLITFVYRYHATNMHLNIYNSDPRENVT